MTKDRSHLSIRAFGMSGAQIAAEVRSVERQFGLALLPVESTDERKLSGYEQFEHDVRRSASEMSQFYEIFYCLEVSIRRLVQNILQDAEGLDWWSSERVGLGLRTEVQNVRKKEAASGMTPRSEDPLDFLTFGQLGQLITDNFDLFENVLSNKPAVSRVMNQLNLLRGPIAHCCVLAEDEKERLELTVKDWFRLLS